MQSVLLRFILVLHISNTSEYTIKLQRGLFFLGFSGDTVVKNLSANAGVAGSLDQENPLEREMATHLSIVAW